MDVNRLRPEDLNRELTQQLHQLLLARIMPAQRYNNPEQVKLDGITNDSNSPVQLDSKQSLTREVDAKECILIDLFREFTKKDEGKVLASELGKFARFAQSESAKSSNKTELPATA